MHSLPTLLDALSTLTMNTVRSPDNPENRFTIATQPTPVQRCIFEPLEVDPVKTFSVHVQIE